MCRRHAERITHTHTHTLKFKPKTNNNIKFVQFSLRALIRLRLYMFLKMMAAHKLVIGIESIAFGAISSKTPLNYGLPRTRSTIERMMNSSNSIIHRRKKNSTGMRREINFPKKQRFESILDFVSCLLAGFMQTTTKKRTGT